MAATTTNDTRESRDAQMAAKGRAWLEAGSDLGEADFAYHPRELHAMTYGLRRWLEAELGVSSSVPV